MAALVYIFTAAAVAAHAQTTGSSTGAASSGPAAQGPSKDDTLDAAEADGDEPRRRLVSWNEYEGPYFTLRVGGGFLYDYSGYSQNSESKQQMALSPKHDLRDFRVLLKGRFKSCRM
jgi:phosphate-selective porin OprO and OprP